MSSSTSTGIPAAPGAGSAAFTTPTKRAAFAASADAGPSRARPAGASPAYSSRRHSLYGIEDRVVIDPGSRIWKIGFSGELNPRSVSFALDSDPTPAREAWDLDLEKLEGVHGKRNEGDRLVGVRIVRKLRETYTKHLMTDPKARKVIVLETTFLPTYVKEHIARALFDNLQVPSVSFAPSSLLALAACGRITGLVVDVGWLETSITPVYHSRPLYTLSHSTPLAGRRFHSHLRNLLLHHGIYVPPPTSLSTASRLSYGRGVPSALLSDTFVERVLTEGCFAGSVVVRPEEEGMDVDEPVSEGPTGEAREAKILADEWRSRYGSTSTAKDMSFRIPSTSTTGTPNDMGPGIVIVPGWIRERGAEILFADDEESEEESVPRAVLGCLLKLPIDIRRDMISSLLVVGGTASLPGFIPRLRISLLHHLLPPPTSVPPTPHSPLNTPGGRKEETALWRRRQFEPYRELYGLTDKLAIVNDPAPLDAPDSGAGGRSSGGKGPRWTPGLMGWVGGSLAGALKISSPEITRESYDTSVQLSLARGEAYREELERSEVEVAASIGVDVEELRAGEAVSDLAGLGRKRGWKEGTDVGDWTRGVRAS